MAQKIAFYNYRHMEGGGETVSMNLSAYFKQMGMEVFQFVQVVDADKVNSKYDSLCRLIPLRDSKDTCSMVSQQHMAEVINEEGIEFLIVQGRMQFPFKYIKENTNCKILFCIHNKPMWEVDVLRNKSTVEIVNPTILKKIEFVLLRKPKYMFRPYAVNKVMGCYLDIIQYIDKLILLTPDYEEEFGQIVSDYKGGRYADKFKDKLYSIVNPLLSPTLDRVKFDQKENIVLYVGRLEFYHKRVDRLLRIWKLVQDQNESWRLQIVGDGTAKESLIELVDKLKLKRVEFVGYSDSVEQYYQRAKMICMTSNFEGLPMCMTEGQQHGVVPVAFDTFGALKMLTDRGKMGSSVKPFSLKLFAAKMSELMANNSLLEDMSRRCTESSKIYDLDVVGGEWKILFNKMKQE